MCINPRSFAKISTSDMSWSRGIPCNGLDNFASALLWNNNVSEQKKREIRDKGYARNNSRLGVEFWMVAVLLAVSDSQVLLDLWWAGHCRYARTKSARTDGDGWVVKQAALQRQTADPWGAYIPSGSVPNQGRDHAVQCRCDPSKIGDPRDPTGDYSLSRPVRSCHKCETHLCK